jgi:hypothetical protein
VAGTTGKVCGTLMALVPELRGCLPCPHLPPAPLFLHLYSLVLPYPAVGPSGVLGVEDLPRISIYPGWRQSHTDALWEGRNLEGAAMG